ncbi:MAG: hypothetical protein EAX96_09910 [Candidatus Lokiarchaeota archaeon]|nr:hypothetical protein [Candidatus Lokiarchaeota archaeon]
MNDNNTLLNAFSLERGGNYENEIKTYNYINRDNPNFIIAKLGSGRSNFRLEWFPTSLKDFSTVLSQVENKEAFYYKAKIHKISVEFIVQMIIFINPLTWMKELENK